MSKLIRFSPLAGIVAVVLGAIAILVIESGNLPGEKPTGLEILTYATEDKNSIFVASLLWGLAMVAYLWFLGALRVSFRGEEGDGAFSGIVYGFGVAHAVLFSGIFVGDLSLAILVDEGSPVTGDTAQALHAINTGIFAIAVVMLGGFFLATAAAIYRTRVLPMWLAVVSVVLAVGAFVIWIGWAVQVFALPLWLIVVSLLLFRRSRAGGEATA